MSETSHFKKMGRSIWLFLYCLLKVNPKTGFFLKSYGEISRETGIKKRTIRDWLTRLKSQDYILTKRKKNGLLIYVKKCREFNKYQNPVSPYRENDNFLPDTQEENDRNMPDSMSKLSYSKEYQKIKKSLYSRGEIRKKSFFDISNVNNVNKDNINNVNVDKYKLKEKFKPCSKEELLALDLAKGLNDTSNFAFYLSISKKYPEEFLRRIYKEVKEIPLSRIKKSRGALFCYFLKRY